MVKPPKTMQPESIDLSEAGRKAGRAFQKDSFHNYMARKIDLQRNQFGVVLPPPPPPFDDKRRTTNEHKSGSDMQGEQQTNVALSTCNYCTPRKVQFVTGTKLDGGDGSNRRSAEMRAKVRYRSSERKRRKISVDGNDRNMMNDEGYGDCQHVDACSNSRQQSPLIPSALVQGILKPQRASLMKKASPVRSVDNKNSTQAPGSSSHSHTDDHTDSSQRRASSDPFFPSPSLKRSRPDLFFLGVVCKTQGFTNPDDETLKRLLHAHGGDLEKYETTRVTHLLAEALSTAKAAYLRSQKRPVPVVHPNWIVDSVKAQKLLPHGNYLLLEMSDDYHDGGGSKQLGIKSMFAKQHQKQQLCPNQKDAVSIDISVRDRNPSDMHHSSKEKKSNTKSTVCPIPIVEAHANDNFSAIMNPLETLSPTKHHSTTNGDVESSSSAECQKDDCTAFIGRTDDRLINGKVRTVGSDPNFLDSFFANSRLSFIGSYKQRVASASPSKKRTNNKGNSLKHGTRFVFHVDMDCFFAAVVLRNFPEYKDKPVAISHHGKKASGGNDNGNSHLAVIDVPKDSTSECATCNYEARKHGLKKGMFLSRAKALCPDLVVLAYDFEGYEDVSRQVEEIVDKVAAEYYGVVEAVSCDEAYIEMFFVDKGPFLSLYDRAFDVAERIRSEIHNTTQCTASIGVANNKLLAKLGGEKVKPNGSYVVREYQDLLKELRLRDLHGVGWRTEPKLADEGLFTVEDVWRLGRRAEQELVRILGNATGKKIYDFCHGRDDRPVKAPERKTIGAECNYGVRFDGPYGIDHFMEGLAKEVSKRMDGCGVMGTKLTLKLKKRKENAGPPPKFLGHGSCYNLSKSADIPLTRDVTFMKNVGMTLFMSFGVQLDDVRGMGITMSGLRHDDGSDSHSSCSAHGMKQWLMNEETSKTDDLEVESDRLCLDEEKTVNSSKEDTLVYEFDSSLHPVDSARHISTRSGLNNSRRSEKPLEHHPTSKATNKKLKVWKASSSSLLVSKGQKSRLLQTDLKRMMKLAAVQSGKEKTDVSLSVLDDLPLQIKLQIVNNDDLKLGSISLKHSSSTRPRVSTNRVEGERRRNICKSSSESACMNREPEEDLQEGDPSLHPSTLGITERLLSDEYDSGCLFSPIPRVSNSYEEDILPLRFFLDKNSPDANKDSEGENKDNDAEEKSAVDLVISYISTVVQEERLSDVVAILRSIRNRRDEWSNTSVLERLVDAADKEYSRVYGTADSVGVDWLPGL